MCFWKLNSAKLIFTNIRTCFRHWGHVYLFWDTIFEKKAFCLLAPPKQMPFLTISNENTFLKTQGSRLGALVAPNKGLEQTLNILGFVLIFWPQITP